MMSEPEKEYETGSEPTAFASAPWEPEGPDQNGHAHVWGSDGDLVATVCDNPVYGETAYDRARLIAAAGTAAQEAQKMGYDPVAAVEALPELLHVAESFRDSLKALDRNFRGTFEGEKEAVEDFLDALASAEGSEYE
jgi:hypothetical protein